jgi:hypothetical protein
VVLVRLTARDADATASWGAAEFNEELFGVLSSGERETLKGLLKKLARRNIQRVR